MKWYGFILIFIATFIFSNYLYTVRLDYTAQGNALISETFPVPDTSLEVMDREIKLSAATMPKQPLIIFFFGSWCRPCLFELPVIEKAAKRGDVPFIGVAVRDNPAKIKRMFEKSGSPYQYIALDPSAEWTELFRAEKLPTAFILDGRGNAVARIRGILTEEFYLQTIVPYLQELKNEKPL